MKLIFPIITAIVILFTVGLSAQTSIDKLMKTQLHEESRLELAQLGSSNDFGLAFGGGSNKLERKSKYKAALFSLILPGAGQYYTNQVGKTKIFFGSEAALWFSYYGFRKYGTFKNEAARGWAVTKAGAYAYNDDDLYWIKMTYYDNRDRNEGPDELGYNQMIAVYERGNAPLFPETRAYYWNWDNVADRRKYRDLRNQSKNAYQRSHVVIGAVIANHIVSAVEAFLSTIKYNRRLEFSSSGFRLRYSVKLSLANPSASVRLTKYFD